MNGIEECRYIHVSNEAKYMCLIVLVPDFMTRICKQAAQYFHCPESRVLI